MPPVLRCSVLRPNEDTLNHFDPHNTKPFRTFLRFHGLSIIWSWMVDVSTAVSDEAATLRMDIIETLCILPITNKNVIEDSKVLSVVQRWAKPDAEEKSERADEKSEMEQSVKVEQETEKGL